MAIVGVDFWIPIVIVGTVTRKIFKEGIARVRSSVAWVNNEEP